MINMAKMTSGAQNMSIVPLELELGEPLDPFGHFWLEMPVSKLATGGKFSFGMTTGLGMVL